MKVLRFYSHGFTLIELMIVLAIVAILAAIAFPSYQDSVLKSRRTDGQSLLLRTAQAQERHFTQFGRYATTLTGGQSPTNLGWSAGDIVSQEGYYSVGVAATATTFTLTATATTADSKCGNLTLQHNGVKGQSIGTTDLCW